MPGNDGRDTAVGRAIAVRNVGLVMAGVAVLVLGPAYDGPFDEAFQAHAGNVAVSFALYFVALNATLRLRWPRLLAACLTLLAVELFEATDGFGVMASTYDPVDFVANAIGVGLAVLVDLGTTRIIEKRHQPTPRDRGKASA